MRKLRDVLRLRHAAGLSIRDISRSTKLSVGGIQKLLSRAQDLYLGWPLPADLDDTRLAQLFYPGADTGSSRRYQVPDLNPSYQQWAEHYQVAVLPARHYRPRDKAKAEVAVLVVQRWILARLRHHRCFSLAEVNQCIAGLLEDLNQRPFKQLPDSRRSAFEALDQPALKPLPRHPYRYVAIKPVTINIDYHVQYRRHYYSVPHQYVGEKLDLHASETLVELYFRQQRVATHPRQDRPGFTTHPAHMPTRHRAQHQWSHERLLRWAREMGPAVGTWVSRQLDPPYTPVVSFHIIP